MKVHFIGIGGIGVSALAKYFLSIGHEINGSDLVSSEITEDLKMRGAEIFLGRHKRENIKKDVKLVIYSPAVKKENIELKEAQRRKILVQSYPQALGELTKKYFTVAISGTHGKSTTTALASLILIEAGLDPIVILGTKLYEFGNSNFRKGKSNYLIIEADEHFASFLNYWPKIIVLTNIEREHLDYYKNLNDILKTYKKYILHLPKNGYLIVNKDDKNISRIKDQKSKIKIINYSLKQKEAKKLNKILKIPGEHNIYNALAALTVARVLKVADKFSFKALSKYQGAWRRFEIKHANLHKFGHRSARITIVSDYGHHPTKVRVTLKAAREKFPRKKIWLIYQPHQYQRTHYLFKDFVKVFREAPVDKIIITDIFEVAGREEEKIKKKVSSKKLVKAINKENVIYIPDMKKAADYVKKNIKGGGMVIIMGAGDIYKMCDKF
jgi:UDP-N-acetylmuramate--alanine ligase